MGLKRMVAELFPAFISLCGREEEEGKEVDESVCARNSHIGAKSEHQPSPYRRRARMLHVVLNVRKVPFKTPAIAAAEIQIGDEAM